MSAVPFVLDPAHLRNAFPPAYLERGIRYLREGRVLTADFNPTRHFVVGRVRGSGGRVYQCIVNLAHVSGGTIALVGQCSCPVGYNCKHVAAVLLSVGEQGTPSPQATRSHGLPPAVQNWLDRAARVADSFSREDPYRVVYLVGRDDHFGLQRTVLRAVKVRRLASGGYGKPQDFNMLGQSRASFVAPEDHRIMALVQAGRDGGVLSEVRLNDETGGDVLHAVALTARGHWQSP